MKNARKLKAYFWIWHILAPFPFKWNGAFWVKRRRFVHCFKKKGISKRCRFERHHKPSSSPRHAENRGRKSCFPLHFASPSLHPTCPRNLAMTHANTGPATTPQWWKKSGEPCPASNSPAHLTLRHDRGKVALSSSAYKYPRRGCRNRGEKRKEKGISKKRKKEKMRGNRERERERVFERERKGAKTEGKKGTGEKGDIDRETEWERDINEKKQSKKRAKKKNHRRPSAWQRHHCSPSP